MAKMIKSTSLAAKRPGGAPVQGMRFKSIGAGAPNDIPPMPGMKKGGMCKGYAKGGKAKGKK